MTYTEVAMGTTESPEHVCSCVNCDPSLASPPERLGPDHLSVNAPEGEVLRGRARLKVDGEDVSEGAVEWLSGDDGWVLLRNKADHRLGRGFHFCERCWPDHLQPKPDRDDMDLICASRMTGRVELIMPDDVAALVAAVRGA